MVDARGFLLGLSSISTTPSTQKPPSALPSSSSSFLRQCYPVRTQKRVSFVAHHHPSSSIARLLVNGSLSISANRRRIECCASGTQKNERFTAAFDQEDYDRQHSRGVERKKLAVFVSGGGSNFKSINEACVQGSIHGEVVVLVTNKHCCGGAEYARNKEVPVILFPRTKDEPDGLSPSDLVTALRSFGVDFILLAGYLKLIPAELIRAYPQSILNIHPSLLPAFGGKGYYGMKVHKAVIASGARYSGPTIHFVDEHYDTGRILAQRVVPVLANDTAEDLAARVLREEHQLYVEATAALCEERVIWREDGVPLIQNIGSALHLIELRFLNNQKKMLGLDPSRRITARSALEHEYLKDIIGAVP